MRGWVAASIFTLAWFVCLVGVSVLVDSYELDGDSLRVLAYSVAPEGVSDRVAAEELMFWVYSSVGGACYENSFVFERLLAARGLESRHVVLTAGAASHATTQVKIGGKWVFFDSYFGSVVVWEDYATLGFDKALVHVDCVDGSCSNWSRLGLLGALVGKIRFIDFGGGTQ